MKNWQKILLGGLTCVGLVVILGFVNHAQKELLCTDLSITVKNNTDHYFIDENKITQTLIDKNLSPIGIKLSKLQLNKLETQLENIAEVENAEVFVSVNGKVTANIKQRNPIVRVINKNGTSFYIDDRGKQMNLSENYTARVPVFTGNINEPIQDLDYNTIVKNEELAKTHLFDEIFELANFLSKDTLFKYDIEQAYITKHKEIVLIPRVGDHKIILGNTSNLEDKLHKLKVFYKKGLNNTDWNKYDTINLKFKNQVVCKIKNYGN